MGAVQQLADWRVRAASRLGAALLCAAAFALLVTASRTFIAPERPAAGVAVLIETERLEPPAPQQAQPRPAAGPGAPSYHAPPESADPSVEAQMLQRSLRCASLRPGQPRPAGCPREAEPDDWRSPTVPRGGVYVREPEPDLERIFTRAERETLVMPSCVRDGSGTCVRFGERPPPPSRSAEQICRDSGLGGPCAPPPEAESGQP